MFAAEPDGQGQPVLRIPSTRPFCLSAARKTTPGPLRAAGGRPRPPPAGQAPPGAGVALHRRREASPAPSSGTCSRSGPPGTPKAFALVVGTSYVLLQTQESGFCGSSWVGLNRR